MENKGIKVIVTGGAGFIGSHLTKKLVELNYEVHVIDNLSIGSKDKIHPKAQFHKLDITNLKSIAPVFKDARFVFHLAALPRVQLSIDDPIKTHEVNVNGTLNILIVSRDAKVKRVIYSASSSAFGDQKKLPLKENLPASPLSPYGLQKHIGENYCRIFSSIFGLATVCLRYFNVYGPGMSEKGSYLPVFVRFLRQRRQGLPMTVFGDGKQTRSFTHVKDVVRANILAAVSDRVGRGEVINICGGRSYSINSVTDIIGGRVIKSPARTGEIKHSYGDASLAEKLLNWQAEIKLEKGLSELKSLYKI